MCTLTNVIRILLAQPPSDYTVRSSSFKKQRQMGDTPHHQGLIIEVKTRVYDIK